MRRLRLGAVLLLAVAGCAQPADSAGSPDQRREAFEQRAAAVAEAWRVGPASAAWRKGFLPLESLTVPPADFVDVDAKQAFLAGWYRTTVRLPSSRPDPGSIRFPDGATPAVPLVSAAEAYAQIDQGDPPPCAGPAAPASPNTGPDSPDSPVSAPAGGCAGLTVTQATLGTVSLRTSRGEAEVPAWLFTVDELADPVVRVAVAPSMIAPLPEAPSPANQAVPGLVAAQNLVTAVGTTLTYRLGIGACDTDVTALVWESEDVVVVGGTVVASDGMCTAQLVLKPVTVALTAPVGSRVVLDALTSQPMAHAFG